MSVTRRIAGSIGKHHSFWAMYSLRMSVWIVPPRRSGVMPVLLGCDDVERQEDRGGGVDRHRDRDLVKRDPVEQGLHVVDRVERHALHSHLTEGAGVIGVEAHQRRHVECRGEPGLAVVEQVAEALVGLLDRAEAGELAHRPQAPAVHRGVHAARVGKLAGVAEVAVGVPAVEILGGVERFDRLAGDGLEQGVALGLLRVRLFPPLVRAPAGVGLDRHGGKDRWGTRRSSSGVHG